jgi:hypothetical protein
MTERMVNLNVFEITRAYRDQRIEVVQIPKQMMAIEYLPLTRSKLAKVAWPNNLAARRRFFETKAWAIEQIVRCAANY